MSQKHLSFAYSASNSIKNYCKNVSTEYRSPQNILKTLDSIHLTENDDFIIKQLEFNQSKHKEFEILKCIEFWKYVYSRTDLQPFKYGEKATSKTSFSSTEVSEQTLNTLE